VQPNRPTRAAYSIDLDSSSVPLTVVRKARARRYTLRVLRDGTARVSMPRWGSARHAVEFANKHRAWIDQQRAKSRAVWEHGTTILFRGSESIINLSECGEKVLVMFGCQLLTVERQIDVRLAIQSYLRSLAGPELIQRTIELAAAHRLSVKSVQIRSQRSRWGSCSSQGRISLNWRLIQTPDSVRDYIIIHELMHLREMNHSHRFWAHVESALPNFNEAERWLRKHSGLLA
jgi:predicted metal-dependent hydrolase